MTNRFQTTVPSMSAPRSSSLIPQADPFLGKWRIVGMEKWDHTYLDVVEPAHITFGPTGDGDHAESGTVVFGTTKGWLDCCSSVRDGKPCIEFSWEGHSNRDDACGRGWAVLEGDDALVGHIFIHCGEDSSFTSRRE